LKNQLVVMGSLEGRLRGVYSLVGPLARLQFILKSIVRDIYRQGFIVPLGFNPGIARLGRVYRRTAFRSLILIPFF